MSSRRVVTRLAQAMPKAGRTDRVLEPELIPMASETWKQMANNNSYHFKLLINFDTFGINMMCHTMKWKQFGNNSNLGIFFLRNSTFWHTVWTWLIRCANTKWIQQVLWKIQSGGTEGQRKWNQYNTPTPIPTPLNFIGEGYNKKPPKGCYCTKFEGSSLKI